MRITDEIMIDERLIEERFVRASGPGGQHVNTTSSAVQLRFDLAASDLPQALKQRLIRLAGSRITAEGVLVLHASEHRSQARNREAARERLRTLILQASRKPKPRKATRPSLASIKRQKAAKAARSRTKALRGKPAED
ncbi:aminoacyl-tRNA hydrolase [Alkalicaulis satelles]|uniref:Aminoacyl-tRNA hydrolase n=1 Tax=Alkalicaulis satelles TaxID=2609175 RepID=A0A5M6ZQN7_9PROT|nr:alternative ribosome rescue aminoacyl-tRNA hydrolase ArfB [Alkalicaulis satelles]KAA5804591.1 aminoacyl-tRNA hydrolase [Alkalicaulis satelles]